MGLKMSLASPQHVPAFNTIQDELNFWKESYNEMSEGNRELKEKLKQLQSYRKIEIKDETEEPPAKRLKTDESMDPLMKLKADGFFEVMKYLNEKELRTAMEVSKSWKSFIHSNEFLMHQVVNGIVVKPNVEGCSLSMVKKLFSEGSEKRNYEHMETPVELKFIKKVSPVTRYAATLKTLVVLPKAYSRLQDEKIDLEGCEFPQLQTLTVRGYEMDFFKRSTFPAVTELKLDNVKGGDRQYKEMKEWMRNFPKLKNLEIKSDSVLYYFAPSYPENPIEDDPLQPKIEKLWIPYYDRDLLRSQQNSLTDLTIKGSMLGIDTVQMSLILQDLKSLKTFDTWSVLTNPRATPDFSPNKSIEIFKCCFMGDLFPFLQLQGNNEQGHDADPSEVLQNILRALPSLKEFTLLLGLPSGLIQFLANNMVNLKKVTYHKLEDGALEAYQEIRSNSHRYLNGDFELIFYEPPAAETYD